MRSCLLGVVLNKIKVGGPAGYYGYGYQTRYSYDYTYAAGGGSKKKGKRAGGKQRRPRAGKRASAAPEATS